MTENMVGMFAMSSLTIDLSMWQPHNLQYFSHMFTSAHMPIPYWADFKDKEERSFEIKRYASSLKYNELDEFLNKNDIPIPKKVKI
jgi:hypothetical protein